MCVGGGAHEHRQRPSLPPTPAPLALQERDEPQEEEHSTKGGTAGGEGHNQGTTTSKQHTHSHGYAGTSKERAGWKYTEKMKVKRNSSGCMCTSTCKNADTLTHTHTHTHVSATTQHERSEKPDCDAILLVQSLDTRRLHLQSSSTGVFADGLRGARAANTVRDFSEFIFRIDEITFGENPTLVLSLSVQRKVRLWNRRQTLQPARHPAHRHAPCKAVAARAARLAERAPAICGEAVRVPAAMKR